MKVLSKPKLSQNEVFTLDMETETTHTYQLSNGIVSHNTASCLLGCASGIHLHHARRYMRQVQANKMETPFLAFSTINPHACEDSMWSANKTDAVISFCCEVDENAKIKPDMTAIEFLEMVKLTQNNWVKYGKNTDRCTQPWLSHNVSNTINVREHEWDLVGNYIFDNQDYFTAVSLLGMTGDKDYHQAPFQAVYTQEEIDATYGAETAKQAEVLIKLGLNAFGNLWTGCDIVLNDNMLADIINENNGEPNDKSGWVMLVRMWAEENPYLNNDRQKATYCLKDVYNLEKFERLKSNYRDVDYISVIENEDNTKVQETVACAGGFCSIGLEI